MGGQGCYIWYSEEGTGRGRSPPSPLLAVLNVTAHPLTASVPITVFLYSGPLLCGFIVAVKGLTGSVVCPAVPASVRCHQQRLARRTSSTSHTFLHTRHDGCRPAHCPRIKSIPVPSCTSPQPGEFIPVLKNVIVSTAGKSIIHKLLLRHEMTVSGLSLLVIWLMK